MHGGVFEDAGGADSCIHLNFHEVGTETLAGLAVRIRHRCRRGDQHLATTWHPLRGYLLFQFLGSLHHSISGLDRSTRTGLAY